MLPTQAGGSVGLGSAPLSPTEVPPGVGYPCGCPMLSCISGCLPALPGILRAWGPPAHAIAALSPRWHCRSPGGKGTESSIPELGGTPSGATLGEACPCSMADGGGIRRVGVQARIWGLVTLP